MATRQCFWTLAVLAMLAAAGCGRLAQVNSRLDAITDDRARTDLRDCLWAAGSKYAWVGHDTLRCQVTRTEHTPAGDRQTEEVWLLDIWGGRVRMERPPATPEAPPEVAVFDGNQWRVFVGGQPSDDPRKRAEAKGWGRAVLELLPLPLSLLGPSRGIEYVGTVVGPGEARSWDRLLVTYRDRPRVNRSDRLVVEIDRATRRIDAVLLQWSEAPFDGRQFRVDLDMWLPVKDLLVTQRWRFTPIDDQGTPTGKPCYTVGIRDAAFDVAPGATAFTKP